MYQVVMTCEDGRVERSVLFKSKEDAQRARKAARDSYNYFSRQYMKNGEVAPLCRFKVEEV